MTHNHFARLDETPLSPPFLVPDAVYLWLLLRQPDRLDPDRDLERIEQEAGLVMDRHIERMKEHDVTLKKPVQLSPLIADSTVGLVFDQAAAQRAALAGRYAQSYFGDLLATLRADHPHLMEIFEERREATPETVLNLPVDAPPNHPLRLLRAAWQFRRAVVIEARPMSMIPIISGQAQGDTPSFTPVLQRVGDELWQLGLEGDAAPVSPRRFEGDIGTVLPDIYAAYGQWYKRDQEWLERQLEEEAGQIPDHLFIPVLARRLQTGELWFGERVKLVNLSHNRLFRLSVPEYSQLFHTAADKAVRRALAAAGNQYPTPPDPVEVETAYLSLLARRGEEAILRRVEPEKRMTMPVSANAGEAWRVYVNQEARVTVAWLAGSKARAVVSGAQYPARAVLLNGQNPARLGLAPFSYRTKKPDLADIWSGSLLSGFSLDDEAWRRAISAWAAWVWLNKASLKRYQPPGGKK